MENRKHVKIWPILYFHADWPVESHKFEFDVCLVKANKKIHEVVGDVTSEAWSSNNKAMCDFHGNTEWFLSLPVPKATEHVSYKEIGMSFESRLQESIVDHFLMSLRLIYQTQAICPLTIDAEIVGESIDPDSLKKALDKADYFGINTDPPPVFMPASFQLEDLQLLTDIWSSIIRRRKLDYWTDRVYKEEFFAKLDKKAVEDAEHDLLEFFLSPLPIDDRKIFKNKISSMIKQAKSNGKNEGLWHEFYSECFHKAFEAEEEETFSNRTRIGRALNLFYEGLLLPKLHAFLSMNLVLETLFTIGKGETTHKLATRLAKIVGYNQSIEERKELYQKAKTVYDERSDVVHGEKLIDIVNIETIKDTFTLARSSLQRILLSDELWGLYSHSGTTDRKLSRGKGTIKIEASQALSAYFLDLDLRI